MLYPPVADLLEKVESRYLLVNEVANGELSGSLKEEYM